MFELIGFAFALVFSSLLSGWILMHIIGEKAARIVISFFTALPLATSPVMLIFANHGEAMLVLGVMFGAIVVLIALWGRTIKVRISKFREPNRQNHE